MSESKIAEEFPLIEEKPQPADPSPTPSHPPEEEPETGESSPATSRFAAFWDQLRRFGVAEQMLRIGTHLLSIVLVVLVGLVMGNFILEQQPGTEPAEARAAAESGPTPTLTTAPLQLPDMTGAGGPSMSSGVTRQSTLHTIIPTRPRVDVITYTVEQGDNLFGIADRFGLKPETILWGNYDVLEDNPHVLSPDQVLNILPVNGTYHQWHEGENLQKVAEFFEVDPSAIIEYPGNNFDIAAIDVESPQIEPGTWLIVPGGQRAIQDWGPPAISRTNPASASYYGPGHCGSIYEGAIGNGTFVWPTTQRTISGYTYNPPIHPAIDIGGSLGNAIYATDNGVVVYAGWSNYGYGYLIVVDHGNGWQSAYAHLSSLNVGCGQSVFQGSMIGGLGSSGNSSGPHLHFELVFNGAKVNPLNFLQ